MSDDPHYQREKEKYDNPVASREYLMSLLKEHDKPLSFLDICPKVVFLDKPKVAFFAFNHFAMYLFDVSFQFSFAIRFVITNIAFIFHPV